MRHYFSLLRNGLHSSSRSGSSMLAAAGCTLLHSIAVLKKIELEVKKFLFFLFLPSVI